MPRMRLSLAKQLARSLRRRRGELTLQQFSYRTGLSVSTISRLEAGLTYTSTRLLGQICAALRCTLHDLYPDEFRTPILIPAPVAL